MTFLESLAEQRWDDHRYYHHSRINQSQVHTCRGMLEHGAQRRRHAVDFVEVVVRENRDFHASSHHEGRFATQGANR